MTALSMVMIQTLSFDRKEHHHSAAGAAKEHKRRPSERLPNLTGSNGLVIKVLSIELFVTGLVLMYTSSGWVFCDYLGACRICANNPANDWVLKQLYFILSIVAGSMICLEILRAVRCE